MTSIKMDAVFEGVKILAAASLLFTVQVLSSSAASIISVPSENKNAK